jgi:hypothetical protein
MRQRGKDRGRDEGEDTEGKTLRGIHRREDREERHWDRGDLEIRGE